MFTPSGWTALLLKKLRIKWCSASKSSSHPDAGESEGYNSKLLWTIPEEEEDTFHTREHLFRLRRNLAIEFSVARGAGDDCNCNLLTKYMQLKSHFRASLKKMRKIAKGSNNPKTQRNSTRPRGIIPARHRTKADEDELRDQCREIYELHRAIVEGRLSLEKILNLRL